jgi:hypothetical protein
MNINTNDWTIYAPVGTTIEEIIQAFESDEDLWSKAWNPTGQSPRSWVLTHGVKNIVFTTGRDKDKIKQANKKWAEQHVKCECGRIVTQGKLSKHKKTAVHLQGLANQID